MYVVACARCQDRLTDVKFVTYHDAKRAAAHLGYPAADGSAELWCAECARLFDEPIDEPVSIGEAGLFIPPRSGAPL